jgi:hypothetical protein
MKKGHKNLNLFGEQVPDTEPPMSRWLRRHDAATFEFRRTRAEHLKSICPRGHGFLLPSESFFVLEEAKLAFLNGADLATVMLAQAFIEHILQMHLEKLDQAAVARMGLKAIVEYIQRHEPQHQHLMGLVDEVRKFRNPFMHLRDIDDPNRLFQRVLATQKSPEEILEDEAKRALGVMYEIAVTMF